MCVFHMDGTCEVLEIHHRWGFVQKKIPCTGHFAWAAAIAILSFKISLDFIKDIVDSTLTYVLGENFAVEHHIH